MPASSHSQYSEEVDLYIDKVNAEKHVRKVRKVDGVRNHVEVGGAEIADADLREMLLKKLRNDCAAYGIVLSNLTLSVKNGTETVAGKVRDYPDRASAIAIVEASPGVKDVIDELDVVPLSTLDGSLRARLIEVYAEAVSVPES
jgi:osmotically-inducible protein OsmY